MTSLVAVMRVMEGQGARQGGRQEGLPGLCTLAVLVQQLQCRGDLHTRTSRLLQLQLAALQLNRTSKLQDSQSGFNQDFQIG